MELQDIIKNIIKVNFASVYCHSCEYEDSDNCEWCDRKSMLWGVSDDYAEKVTSEILSHVGEK